MMVREMKDSGVKWIGAIPQDWLCARLKDIKSGQKYAIVDGPFGTAISTSDYVDEGIPLVRILNLGTPNILTTDLVHITEEHAETIQRSRFGIGDIIFAKTGATIGKCAINDSIEYGILSSSCVKITLNPLHNAKFYYYFFFTQQFNDALRDACVGTTRDTINLSPFSCLPCVIPPATEQLRIASFLDRKCTEIDSAITDTKKTIDEYKALKQSIITEAVTKGVHGKRPMKDSGVEWVKQIPIEWDSINPKALFKQRKDKASAGEKQLTASQQYGVIYQEDYMEITGSKIVTVEKDFDILKHVEAGDFVISMRSFQGGLEYSALCGSISSAYVMLIPDTEKVYPRFFRWLLKSPIYINALQSTSNMVRDGQAMRYSNFAQVRLYTVPMAEQVEIADYLDEKCAAIDLLISQKTKLLEEMETYKKSVIYEYVTGKKEVPTCQ